MIAARDPELPWLRLYTAMLNDDKMLLLCKSDRYCYIELLMLKRMGVLDSNAPLREMRIASQLRCTVPQLLEVTQRLIDVGLIDERWQPRAWVKRQFPSALNGAERMRRYRERQSDEKVTAPSQNVTRSDVLDSETESEKRTESEAPPTPLGTNRKQDTPRPSAGSAEGGTARKRASPRGSKRMPDDYHPSEQLIAWAVDHAPAVDMHAELQAIRDHEFRNAHTDWDAVVRNWLRREQKQLGQRARASSNGRESKFNRMQRRQDEI